MPTLNALRGIFALFIFFHHVPWQGAGLFPAGGDSGVAFFLMLSGFVLYMKYAPLEAAGNFSPRHFLTRRFSKIFPLHWIVLALTVIVLLVSGAAVPWKALVANALLLQSWIPVEAVYFSFNAVAWYLSVMVFAYVMFPLLLKVDTAHGSRLTVIAVAGAVIVACVAPLIKEEWLNGAIYVFPALRLIDFMIGMMLARFMLFVSSRFSGQIMARQRLLAVAQLAAVGFLILVIAIIDEVPASWRLSVVWWPVMAALILLAAVGDRLKVGAMRRLSGSRVLVFMGAVSFPFFMIHSLCIKLCRPLLVDAGLADMAVVVIILLIAVGAAWLLGYLTRAPHALGMSPQQ